MVYLGENMNNWKKAKDTEWYREGGMLGYIYGKENLDVIEDIIKDKKLNKTKIQKFIINNTLDFGTDDWHYFNNFSKKDISHLKHALKKVTKSNVLSELHWIEARSGMLRTPLGKTLHVLAYKLQPEKYIHYASRVYISYGMDDKSANQRSIDLVKGFENGLMYKW